MHQVYDLSRTDEAVHEEREEGEREPEHAVLLRALGDLAWHTLKLAIVRPHTLELGASYTSSLRPHTLAG